MEEVRVDEEIIFKMPVGMEHDKDSLNEEDTEPNNLLDSVEDPDNMTKMEEDKQMSMGDHEGKAVKGTKLLEKSLKDNSSQHKVTKNKSRVMIRPDKYDGSGDWEEYITHFRTCARLGCWDATTMVDMLAVSLEGTARRFYAGIPEMERDDYHKVEAALCQRFGSQRKRDQYKNRLSVRKRKIAETACSLADDIWQLTQRGYPDFDFVTQEQLALDAFLNSISTELKIRCMDQHSRSIDDAVAVVERYEALLQTEREKKQTVRVTGVEKPTERMDEMDKKLDFMAAKLDELVKINYGKGQNMNSQRQNPKFQQQNSNGNGSKQEAVCYSCGSPEHFMRDCPVRHQNRKFQNNQRGFYNQSGNAHPSNC